MPWFEGNLLTQRHQITSLETRDPRLPYGENPESLSHLGLIRYRVVSPQADGQTDRIPIANTRSQQYLPVQLMRVKTTHYRNPYRHGLLYNFYAKGVQTFNTKWKKSREYIFVN